jgi:hypothetical protein
MSFLDQADACKLPFDALMPEEVDDEYIHKSNVLPQPPGTISLVIGFNLNSLVFLASYTSRILKEPCSCTRAQDPQLEIQHLQRRLNELKYLLDDIPSVLQPWATFEEQQSSGSGEEFHSQRVLCGQLASLRVNLHTSHLWFQNLLSTQLDELLESQIQKGCLDVPTRDIKLAWTEYEDLCRQTLSLLRGVPTIYIEPNGQAIVRSFAPFISGQIDAIQCTNSHRSLKFGT